MSYGAALSSFDGGTGATRKYNVESRGRTERCVVALRSCKLGDALAKSKSKEGQRRAKLLLDIEKFEIDAIGNACR